MESQSIASVPDLDPHNPHRSPIEWRIDLQDRTVFVASFDVSTHIL